MAIYRLPLFTIETSPTGTFAVGNVRIYDNFSGATFDIPQWALWGAGLGIAALVGFAVLQPAQFKKTFAIKKFRLPRLPKFKL